MKKSPGAKDMHRGATKINAEACNINREILAYKNFCCDEPVENYDNRNEENGEIMNEKVVASQRACGNSD
jgi:hypothetical protein